jgi:hypothetical protein
VRLETPKWSDTPKYWPLIEPWIAKALMHGGVTLFPRDVFEGLMSRAMKLWLAIDGQDVKACCVTQLANYPRMKCLNILCVGGTDNRMSEWLHFYEEIERYAKVLDCEAIEFFGREGWKRAVSEYGFTPVISIYRKQL